MLTLQHETEVAGGAGVVQVALPNDFDALVNEAKEKLQLTKVFKLFQQDGTKRSARDAITNLLQRSMSCWLTAPLTAHHASYWFCPNRVHSSPSPPSRSSSPGSEVATIADVRPGMCLSVTGLPALRVTLRLNAGDGADVAFPFAKSEPWEDICGRVQAAVGLGGDDAAAAITMRIHPSNALVESGDHMRDGDIVVVQKAEKNITVQVAQEGSVSPTGGLPAWVSMELSPGDPWPLVQWKMREALAMKDAKGVDVGSDTVFVYSANLNDELATVDDAGDLNDGDQLLVGSRSGAARCLRVSWACNPGTVRRVIIEYEMCRDWKSLLGVLKLQMVKPPTSVVGIPGTGNGTR
jgi:hypothetical protein